MRGRKSRILVASSPGSFARLDTLLQAFETMFVATFADAKAALRAQRFDLVMIGLYFDESRMFELLHHITSEPDLEALPVICFRGIVAADTRGRVRLEAIEAACTAKGARAFFDIAELSAGADSRLESCINSLLKAQS